MRACHILTNAVISVAFEETTPGEPVTLATMKDYLKVSVTDDDNLIEGMIIDARQWIEKRCGISLKPKTVTAIIEVMNEQELPYGPVVLDSVIVRDEEGEEIESPRLVGLSGDYVFIEGRGRFMIEYEAGYATPPKPLQEAIKAYVAYSYENRGDELRSGDIDQAENQFARIARNKSNPYRRTVGF